MLQQPLAGQATVSLTQGALQYLQPITGATQSSTLCLKTQTPSAGPSTTLQQKPPQTSVASVHNSHHRLLGEKLMRFGTDICADLPSRHSCSNPDCTNVREWSEWQLVSGIHAQVASWQLTVVQTARSSTGQCIQQHAACKRLRAAKAAAAK